MPDNTWDLVARSQRAAVGLLGDAVSTSSRRLTGRGHANAEIAAELFLGETTVKTHLGRVLDRLGLRDRSRAIAYAYESGLLEPGDR